MGTPLYGVYRYSMCCPKRYGFVAVLVINRVSGISFGDFGHFGHKEGMVFAL